MAALLRYLRGTPGPSGFGSATTGEDVVIKHGASLNGKVVIVTGANSGIGFEAARVMAPYAGTIIVACRNEKVRGGDSENTAPMLIMRPRGQNATEAAAKIRAESPGSDVRGMTLDLSSFASIRAFAASFKALALPLHVLVCNAGVMATPREFTADGWELQFGTNHLGHFLLTHLLLDNLLAHAPSRVVVLSSRAHEGARSKIDYDNLRSERSYSAWAAYSRSKLCNVYFARELARRFGARGLTAVAVHPGVIATPLWRHNSLLSSVATFCGGFAFKSIPQGAATTVYAATAPEVAAEHNGQYFADCNEERATPLAMDEAEATKLWEFSIKAVAE